MAKVDWHVVPCLCIMYLLAFLDRYESPLQAAANAPTIRVETVLMFFFFSRVNISNAAVLGMTTDLDIAEGTKYNTALTIFFVPYVIFEIPSNILLKKLRPHVWCMCRIFLLPRVCVANCCSVTLHVFIWCCHNLPGPSHELGWSNDHPLVFG